MRPSSAALRSGVSKAALSVSRIQRMSASGRALFKISSIAERRAGANEIVRVLPFRQHGEGQALARQQFRQSQIDGAVGGAAPGLVAVEAQVVGSSAMRQSRPSCSSVSAVPSGATAPSKPAVTIAITST